MIINIIFHFILITHFFVGNMIIESYINLVGSLIFSYFICENIINFFSKKKMSWLRGDDFYFHKDGKDKGVRLSIFIFCVIVEGIIILSFFKIINLWPTGLK